MKNGPYELVVAPPDYPGKRYRGKYCYEHHLVYWRARGAIPKRGEVVHHKDENKRNNAIDNLTLKTVGEHNREHHRVELLVQTCASCGAAFRKESEARVEWKREAGQRDFYCNRSCMGAHFGRGRPKRSGVAQRGGAAPC